MREAWLLATLECLADAERLLRWTLACSYEYTYYTKGSDNQEDYIHTVRTYVERINELQEEVDFFQDMYKSVLNEI